MAYVWTGGTWRRSPTGSPLVLIFARDITTDESKVFGVENFTPYFYAGISQSSSEWNGLVSCFGDPIEKIEVPLPSDVPIIRKEYATTFEADILYDMRYVIDRGIYYGFDIIDNQLVPVDIPTQQPIVMGFDIEVDCPSGIFPTARDAYYPITHISFMVWKGDFVIAHKVLSIGPSISEDHISCDDERDVLRQFVESVSKYNPDIIGGWNSKNFDIPYIINRAYKLKVNVVRLTRNKSQPSDSRWTGRSLIDFMEYFKIWSKPIGEQESFRLKFIAGKFANFTYVDEGAHIHKMIEDGRWEDIAMYSFNDSRALFEIDKSTGLIAFFERLRQLMGVKFEDLKSKAKIIEYYLMHEGIKPMPTTDYSKEASDFKGALVVSPPVGIIDWVGVTDLASLYPTIILAFNISPDIDGIVPKVLTKLMNERNRLRQIKLDGNADDNLKTSEQALKYQINAFYGYYGFSGGRLYRPKLAGQITEEGRNISLAIHQKLKDLGYILVYGDTDSTFFTSVKTPEEARNVEREINNFLQEWTTSHNLPLQFAPTVKLEKIYKRIMFKQKSRMITKSPWKPTKDVGSAKKRYIGHLTWKDGFPVDKLDYTGIEIKRSDTAQITKMCMEEFFTMVVRDNNIPGGLQIIRDYYKGILNGKYPPSLLMIPKGVSNTTEGSTIYHKGMIYGQQLFGINFTGDNKPCLLHICGKQSPTVCVDNSISDDVILDAVEIDYDIMADKVIKKKMLSLIESLGYTWASIEGCVLPPLLTTPTEGGGLFNGGL